MGTVSGEAVPGRRFGGVQGSLELQPAGMFQITTSSSTATSDGITGNKIEKDSDEVATRCFDERISALTSAQVPRACIPTALATPSPVS